MPRLAINVDQKVHEEILAAAAREGLSVSAWMSNLVEDWQIRRNGLAAIELWEQEHGAFTPEEIEASRKRVTAQIRRARTVRRTA